MANGYYGLRKVLECYFSGLANLDYLRALSLADYPLVHGKPLQPEQLSRRVDDFYEQLLRQNGVAWSFEPPTKSCVNLSMVNQSMPRSIDRNPNRRKSRGTWRFVKGGGGYYLQTVRPRNRAVR